MGRADKRRGFERPCEGGAPSQTEHLETGAGAQDLRLPTAKVTQHPAQPCLGDGNAPGLPETNWSSLRGHI